MKQHWPDIPVFDDVTTLTKQTLIETGVIDNGRTIDIISAGYPCQPFSVAGNRKGADDERHLWPEVSRLLKEIRPTWFLGENVAGHVTLGLDEVLSDLDRISYSAEPFIIPAAAVGALHRRDRVFILAYSDSERLQGWTFARSSSEMWQRADEQFQRLLPTNLWADVSDSDLSREANGVPNRMDRVKALGNAVVPQQVYPILWAMKQIHDQMS